MEVELENLIGKEFELPIERIIAPSKMLCSPIGGDELYLDSDSPIKLKIFKCRCSNKYQVEILC